MLRGSPELALCLGQVATGLALPAAATNDIMSREPVIGHVGQQLEVAAFVAI